MPRQQSRYGIASSGVPGLSPAGLLALTNIYVPVNATGYLTSLKTSLKGATFEKVYGRGSVGIEEATGRVGLSFALVDGETAGFRARVNVPGGDIFERSFTITGRDVPAITSLSALVLNTGSAGSRNLAANQDVTWALDSGADSALFSLAGNVLTLSAQDIDDPQDADADNGYSVQIRATSLATGFSSTQAITFTVAFGAVKPTDTARVFTQGYNYGSCNYYPANPNPWLNDWGKFVTFLKQDALDSNGNPIWLCGIPTASIVGIHDIETDKGVTIETYNPGGSWSVLSSNPTTGKHVVQIHSDVTGDRFLYMLVAAGVTPTFFTVSWRGREGQKINPDGVAAIRGQVARNLDISGANWVPPVSGKLDRNKVTDRHYKSHALSYAGKFLPYQDWCDVIAAKMAADPDFIGPWEVIPADFDEDDIRALLTYYRDTLPSRAKIRLEWNNESPWGGNPYAGSGGFGGARRSWANAVRLGLYGNGTYANRAPTCADFVDLGYAAADQPVARAFNQGDFVLRQTPGVGFVERVYRARQSVPSGQVIPNDTYWEDLGGLDRIQRGREADAVMLWKTKQIAEEVFGPARFKSQIVLMKMGMKGEAPESQFGFLRTFIPGMWEFLQAQGEIGISHYWGPDTAKLGKVGDTYTINPITEDMMEEAHQVGRVAVENDLLAFVKWCVQNSMQPASYEGQIHPDFNGMGQVNWGAAYYAWQDSPRGQAFMKSIALWMRRNFPGVACFFGLYGRPWGLKDNWSDDNDPRWLSWQAGMAEPLVAPVVTQIETTISGIPRVGSTTSLKLSASITDGAVQRVRYRKGNTTVKSTLPHATDITHAVDGDIVPQLVVQGLGGATLVDLPAIKVYPAQHPDTAALLTRMGADLPTAAERTAIDDFIFGMVLANIWEKVDWCLDLSAHSEAVALLDWKRSRAISKNTQSGPVEFTARRGFKGAGGWLRLPVPWVSDGTFQRNDATIGVYCNEQGSFGGYRPLISSEGTPEGFHISPNEGGHVNFHLHGGGPFGGSDYANGQNNGGGQGAGVDRRGLRMMTRSGDNVVYYAGGKNRRSYSGASTAPATSVGTILQRYGAVSNDRVAFACSASFLTEAQVAEMDRLLGIYLGAKGAA